MPRYRLVVGPNSPRLTLNFSVLGVTIALRIEVDIGERVPHWVPRHPLLVFSSLIYILCQSYISNTRLSSTIGRSHSTQAVATLLQQLFCLGLTSTTPSVLSLFTKTFQASVNT